MASASDLEQKIIGQVEYYFGDLNLPYDKFLQEKIKESEDGWVPLEVIVKFKRLASLSEDSRFIAEALNKSEEKLVLVNDEKTKIKRNPDKPLLASNEEDFKKLEKRSVYTKGFPLDSKLNDIVNFVKKYSAPESVIRRTDIINHKFNGSCFIIFKDIETAKKFVTLKSLKFKNKELVRIMQEDYYSLKNKKIERKKQRKEMKEAMVNEQAQQIHLPNGAIIQFSGPFEGNNWTIEELKETLKQASGFEVVYIDFNQGGTEWYARFSKENNAVDFIKTLTNGEMLVGDKKLEVKALEGDEEKEYLMKTAKDIASQRLKQKNSRKRKGGNYGEGLVEGRDAKHAKKVSDNE